MERIEIDLSVYGRGKLIAVNAVVGFCAVFFALVTVGVLIFEPWWAASVPALGTIFFGFFAVAGLMQMRRRFAPHGFLLDDFGIVWFTATFHSGPVGWHELGLVRVAFHVHGKTGLPANQFLELYPRDPRDFAARHVELAPHYGQGLVAGVNPDRVVPYRFLLPPVQDVVVVLERAVSARVSRMWGRRVPENR